MNPIFLKNAGCLEIAPPSCEKAHLRIVDGTIAERGRNIRPRKGDTVEDLTGKILMPGLVCGHTHLYSSLARGMPPAEQAPSEFLEILRTIWWRLDRALEPETVYYSALAGALEAARCGVTTLIDHHSSPNAIEGSLDLVKKALGEIGLRGVLCYETSDRNGIERRDWGLAENEVFLDRNSKGTMIRGMVGAHASFTLSDDSLKQIGEIAERFGVGVHIHVAEAEADPRMTRARSGRGILERFEQYGITRKGSIFAHCVHLSNAEHDQLLTEGAWLVHNPRSNMNNGVGHAALSEFGSRAVLGTDGFPPDMFEEMRAGHFRDQETPSKSGLNLPLVLNNGQKLVSDIFGRRFGVLRKGSPADLIVLEYIPATPMTTTNLLSHVLFGFRSSMIESVMVNGRWIVRNRTFTSLKERELLRAAAAAARKLWRAMDAVRL